MRRHLAVSGDTLIADFLKKSNESATLPVQGSVFKTVDGALTRSVVGPTPMHSRSSC